MAVAVEPGSANAGFRSLFFMITPNETSYQRLEDVPEYVLQVGSGHGFAHFRTVCGLCCFRKESCVRACVFVCVCVCVCDLDLDCHSLRGLRAGRTHSKPQVSQHKKTKQIKRSKPFSTLQRLVFDLFVFSDFSSKVQTHPVVPAAQM